MRKPSKLLNRGGRIGEVMRNDQGGILTMEKRRGNGGFQAEQSQL